MVEFATLNARLTDVAKRRVGELVTFVPRDRADLPNIRAVVDRNAEIVGQKGQVSDLRITASLPIVDVGTDVDGGRVKTTLGDYFVDSILENDGEFIKVALR